MDLMMVVGIEPTAFEHERRISRRPLSPSPNPQLHTVSRFSSERPHLRPLLSCGVRLGAESTDEKKPLEKTPGEKPIALWAISAPNGAGVLSNGYRFVGISPPTEQTLSQLIGVCTTPTKKIGVRGLHPSKKMTPSQA